MERGRSINTQSQAAPSPAYFPSQRNSSSPMQRQVLQPNYALNNQNYLPSHQHLQQSSPYRSISPASSINSDGGSRYVNPSFQNKQPPLLASTHLTTTLSPTEKVHSSTFQQRGPYSSESDAQVSIPRLKPNLSRLNGNDCRLTINPAEKYAINECEEPQSWAPLLKAAQQESSL